MSDTQKQNELFQGLTLSLAAGVMQHLGKTLNPMTQKIEKNLQAAQATIDMLDMLEAKTKGNLEEGESKILTHVLSELKMNYVETLNEKPAESAKSVEEPKTEESEPEKPEEASEPEADAASESTEAPADKSEKKSGSTD